MRIVCVVIGAMILAICSSAISASGKTGPSATKANLSNEPVNVALFARVLTWDPDRKTGCTNGRVDEFPAAELYLEEDVVPRKDGSYVVPVTNGKGCIGLEWLERRRIREIGIEFADAVAAPADAIQAEYWVFSAVNTHSAGGSKWQGNWEPLPGKVTLDGDKWTCALDSGKLGGSGVLKVRWILSSSSKPVVVKRVWALTHSEWATADLNLQIENGRAGRKAKLTMYNGVIVDSKGSESTSAEWNSSKPLRLKVRYCTTTEWMTDRTVLRMRAPRGSCGVAVDDVLANGCVYVKDYGIFVADGTKKIALEDYKKQIASKQTVLERVREMPDQTYKQSIEHVTRSDAHLGPTVISLACDNHKFVISRDGTIDWDTDPKVINEWDGWPPIDPVGYHLKVQYGAGTGAEVSRHLHEGWLPIPVTTTKDGQVTYTQRSFVAPSDNSPLPSGAPVWMNRKPLCVSEFVIENQGQQPAPVSVNLKVTCELDKLALAQMLPSERGALIERNGKLLAAIDSRGCEQLATEIKDGVCSLSGSLAAGRRAVCMVYIPGWDATADELTAIDDVDELLASTVDHWNNVMRSSLRVDIPEKELQNAILASQVHCYLAARNEDYDRVAPWIASMIYGPFESEAQAVIMGMAYSGNADFARRGLDYFIKRYNKQGFLTTGYSLMGTGWHLWAIGEYSGVLFECVKRERVLVSLRMCFVKHT